MQYQAKFHVFMEVNKLLEKIIPSGFQCTPEQADAIHAFAKNVAKDLLSKDENGQQIYSLD
jgi:hypothetical protein